MTPQEQQHARDVLEFFYPNALEPNQEISPELVDLAAQMLQEALERSHAIDWVPCPPGVRPGIGWLISEAVQAFSRTQGRQKITRPSAER